ncbi:hypothetical protein V7S79_08415 [Aquirufa sp. ROCK-SH2]
MQKKIQFFRLFIFLPVLFWLVAKPITVTSSPCKFVKTSAHSKSSQEKSSPQATFYADHQVYQAAANLNIDFPTDWTFSAPVFTFFAEQLHQVKLPVQIHRTQLLSILFTQFIATLAP